MNENMTVNNIINLAQKQSIDIDFNKIMNENEEISTNDLNKIAGLLNIELEDLLIPNYKPEDEVVVKHSKKDNK